MIALAPRRRCVSSYPDGRVYTPAHGRYAPRARIEDRLRAAAPVVQGRPSPDEFVRAIVREMRIRFYQPKTVKNYRNALEQFLRWFGGAPHRVTREAVREYLLYLVDAGASSSWVSINLAAIRTVFDKMCLRDVTLGLMSPRKPKRLPVVLSVEEVRRLLSAAPSLRDKLLLGIMYATGLRVSEAVRLRWRDVDFGRRLINIWQGKGRRDRQVMLPATLEPLLRRICDQLDGDGFIFPSEQQASRRRSPRHLSIRTAERIMERAVRIAGIKKRATPHTLRHSYAAHSFEHGCDIRRIQKILGHVHLETTTVYVRVARPADDQAIPSPLDVMHQRTASAPAPEKPTTQSVGRVRFHFKPEPQPGMMRQAKVTLEIPGDPRPVYLTGIIAKEVRRGWITLEIPPLEQWEERLLWLTPAQRERICEPAFFELLQREIPQRLPAAA